MLSGLFENSIESSVRIVIHFFPKKSQFQTLVPLLRNWRPFPREIMDPLLCLQVTDPARPKHVSINMPVTVHPRNYLLLNFHTPFSEQSSQMDLLWILVPPPPKGPPLWEFMDLPLDSLPDPRGPWSTTSKNMASAHNHKYSMADLLCFLSGSSYVLVLQ